MKQTLYILLKSATMIVIAENIIHVFSYNPTVIFYSKRIKVGYSSGFFA